MNTSPKRFLQFSRLASQKPVCASITNDPFFIKKTFQEFLRKGSRVNDLQDGVSIQARRLQHGADASPVKDKEAITDQRQFAWIRGSKYLNRSSLGQRIHQSVDLRPGPDIDAPRRVVEQQDRRLRFKPFRKDHLLLIPAR